MRVYATAGQGADDRYVILARFMFPDTIYRRADVAAFDLVRFTITELRMAVNKGRGLEMQTTQDAALIAEVLARLKEPGPLVAATEPYDNYRVE
ncbi:MAG TPA: hypothetical protein PLG21_18230, partial [Anaerolineae bacterium]|nr:hypothetical protein [Anaerolineae bacterium]